MTFFTISIVAGFLTVLAPCILPLLPIVIGSTGNGKNGISKRSLIVIASLAVSVTFFTLILKASTALIVIPQAFWQYFSGSVLILVGMAIVFPNLWTRLPLISKLSIRSNKAVGAGYQKHSLYGDMLIGGALGPVFTTCSPTYLLIIATILPASFLTGMIYLFGFVAGLVVALLLIAYFGERLTNAVAKRMGTAEGIKRIFGILIVIVGLAIMTGFDKKLETKILDSGYGATIEFENNLLQKIKGTERLDKDNIQNMNSTSDTSAIQNNDTETITLSVGVFGVLKERYKELMEW